MKRRDAFKLATLSIAGLAGTAGKSSAQPGPGMMHGMGPMRQPPTDGAHQGGPKPLAIRYLETVKAKLEMIRRTQSDTMLETAHAMARTVARGNTVWTYWDTGHSASFDIFDTRPAVPQFFGIGYDITKTKKGDMVLATTVEPVDWEDAAKKNVFVVGRPVPWGGDSEGPQTIVESLRQRRVKPHANIWIDTKETKSGPMIELPGAPVPFGPVSGIIGLTMFWMMTSDACRILAQDGKKAAVSGDEPELKSDRADWISTETPIMGDCFTQFMNRYELIASEMGAIREAAGMAVDSALGGGTAWCYSRFQGGLPSEGHGRRGGLFLTKGLTIENGSLQPREGRPLTAKDTVFMDIREPDHPTDLTVLDAVRKIGMKVVSFGPTTRGFAIPEGRTVPKEADVHIGRMSDTWGIYAVPGFPRRICPTSGATVMQSFWMTCMEIADQIIRRTGNVPAFYMSGAIEGSQQYNGAMQTKFNTRGY